MQDQQRYSDYGTPKQAQMKNRIVLGDERGGRKRAYVLSNMDVIRDFDKDIIDDIQIEAGKTYWSWRDISGKEQGYGESPAYADRVDDPENFLAVDSSDESETAPGAVREQFIILCGLMAPDYLRVINACCSDADEENPMRIIQAFQLNGLCLITFAFEALEKNMPKARKIFEQRLQNAVDCLLEKA